MLKSFLVWTLLYLNCNLFEHSYFHMNSSVLIYIDYNILEYFSHILYLPVLTKSRIWLWCIFIIIDIILNLIDRSYNSSIYYLRNVKYHLSEKYCFAWMGSGYHIIRFLDCSNIFGDSDIYNTTGWSCVTI